MSSKKNRNKHLKRVGMKTVKEELFWWTCKQHAMNNFLDRQTLREKVLELLRMRGLKSLASFKCSDKWLTLFLKEYGFPVDPMSDAGPTFNDYNDWIDMMRSTMSKYRYNELFHADELTMYSDVLPSAVLQNDLADPENTESLRNRVTALMCCNSTGTTKLPLLICGPYPSTITVKEHVYSRTRDSYISDELFRSWLLSVNDRMVRCERKILLFLKRSRASSLKNFAVSNVQLVYFPENFPSHLRPLRRDIFHYVKMVFRQRYAERLRQYTTEWDLRDILASLIEAWETIPREFIVFSFQRTRFRTDDCFLQINCDCWDSLRSGISFRKFVTFDDHLSNAQLANRHGGYNLRQSYKTVIEVNEDNLEQIPEEAANVEPASFCTLSLNLTTSRTNPELEGDVVTLARENTWNDKHSDAQRTRLIEEDNEQGDARDRTYSDTQLPTKKRSANGSAYKSKRNKNAFSLRDSNCCFSKSIGKNSIAESSPTNFWGQFSQPSTSAKNFDRNASKRTAKRQLFPEMTPPEEASSRETCDGSENLNEKSSSSSFARQEISSFSKKRRKSANRNASGDDSQDTEPKQKKSNDQNWTKKFETTFVFGSPDANCISDVHSDVGNANSCIRNARPPISPKD